MEHPDSALLALGSQFEAAWTKEKAFIDATNYNAPEREDDDDLDNALIAHADAISEIVDKIKVLQARTIEGLLVKARAVSWCHDGNLSAEFVAREYGEHATDVLLLWSIALDLVGMAGQGPKLREAA